MAVAAAVDLVDDRQVEVAAAQEVRVQRMHLAPLDDGRIGGGERLPEHLPAEHLRAADVAARTAEQVHLEPLELELPQQVGQAADHGAATPRRFCITGLVVVYWRNCFFSG